MFSRGYEYFAIIPRVVGKGWRPARDAALTLIEEVIDSGAEPGPVSDVGLHVETEVADVG